MSLALLVRRRRCSGLVQVCLPGALPELIVLLDHLFYDLRDVSELNGNCFD